MLVDLFLFLSFFFYFNVFVFEDISIEEIHHIKTKLKAAKHIFHLFHHDNMLPQGTSQQ